MNEIRRGSWGHRHAAIHGPSHSSIQLTSYLKWPGRLSLYLYCLRDDRLLLAISRQEVPYNLTNVYRNKGTTEDKDFWDNRKYRSWQTRCLKDDSLPTADITSKESRAERTKPNSHCTGLHLYQPKFEICVLLAFYTAWNGRFIPTFRDNISVPPLKAKQSTAPATVHNPTRAQISSTPRPKPEIR
jgi:hypothetical protein